MAQFVELLGDKLSAAKGTVSTEEALRGKTVALYFSAHWCPPCRGFTPKLAEWYNASLAAKGLEVVFVSSDRDVEAFNEYFETMPWKALPFEERDLKAKLSKKFKVNGIPTLVLLDETAAVITLDGRSAVTNDPTGEDFPWRPKPFKEVLGTKFVGQDNATLDQSAVEGKVLGLYFSAHWCPPCRMFTPKLAEWYKHVSPKLPNFEIVFVSSDGDEDAFSEYFKTMPWIALPYEERKRKDQLSDLFEVSGIPTFVIVDADGKVITTNGRSIPTADPEAQEFPWHPKPVKDMESDLEGIQESPSLVVFMDVGEETTKAVAKQALQTVAEEYQAKARASGEDQEVLFFTGGLTAVSVLNRIRSLTKQPLGLVAKHPHPLVEVVDRANWSCDGCNESAEEGAAAFNCKDCNFDFCKDCNAKAVDPSELSKLPLTGVLLDLGSEGAYYNCEGVDFTSVASIKEFLQKFHAGSLPRLQA